MKYLFIAFLFISSISYGQGIEPSSFQPTPYLGGVLRGVTPFVDEFTGQTYYLYVHDSLDAAVPYVDTIFMTDFNLYYIKNGDTIYVGSVTDSSFIYNVVSDTFALDMDIDSTNELQELFHQDNILVLTGAGPDSQVDLTTYMNVDTIYMNDYDLWYYNLLESEPYFIGNVTDSSYIKQVVSDSSTVVENDYGTIIVESPANTFGVTVDSTKFFTKYQGDLKFTLPSLTNGSVIFSNGTTLAQDNSKFFWDDTYNRLGVGTTTPANSITTSGNIQSGYGFITPNSMLLQHGGSWNDGTSLTIQNYLSTYVTFKPSGTTFNTNVGVGGATGSTQFPLRSMAGYTDQPGQGAALFEKGDGTDIMFISSNGNVGIGTDIFPSQTLHVAGTARITSSDGTSTTIMGRDGDGDVSAITPSYGIILASNLLKADTSATGLATAYDITQLGDITEVTVSAPVTGGGTSGSVNIAVDTTDATAAALATQFDLLGKQATLVSGTNIKTVNSNSLVGSGNVSVGTVTSITAAAPLTGGAITTSGTIGVDTTASTGSALATQHDISTKVSGSGTDNYIPRFNGTTAIENSNIYDDGTNIGIGTTSPTAKLSVAGALKVTGSTSGNTRIWGYDHTDGTMGIITIGSGLSLAGDALSSTATGTVTSVGLSAGTGISIGGTNPVTTSGTISVTNTAPNVNANLTFSGASSPVSLNSSDGTDVTFTAGTGISLGMTSNNLTITNSSSGVSGAGTSPRLAFWTGTGTIDDAVALNWDAATARLSLGWAGTPPRSLSIFGDAQISDLNPASVTVTKLVGADNSGNFKSPTLAAELGFTTGTLGLTNGGVSLSKLVTSTGPNVLGRVPGTSGAPTYNTIGTGIEYNSNQLTATTSHYGFLSDQNGSVTGFAINTTPVKVDFDEALSGLAGTMTVSHANNNITVTAAGGYEINYGVCISGVASTRQISITIYKNSSSQAPTKKSFFVTSGDEDCASGSHIMVLNANDVIDLQIATSGAETVTLTGPQLSLKRLY